MHMESPTKEPSICLTTKGSLKLSAEIAERTIKIPTVFKIIIKNKSRKSYCLKS